ncbi:MAG: hypothetical protein ACLGI8_00440 [Acidimicrobiia bacterium]
MTVLSDASIHELAAIRGEAGPITTCYLDVDGRHLVRQQDVEQELETLLRSARQRADDDPSVLEDLARIEKHVRAGIDRQGVRGLVFVASVANELWQVIPLPVRVRSQVVVNSAPAVAQLESILQSHEPIGVLLADRQRARLFVFELGELVEHSELLDELPRDYDSRGQSERGTPESHVEELAHQHLRHAARAAFQVFQERPFEHLVVGASEAVAGELEAALHPYLRERLGGRIHVAIDAPASVVQEAAEAVELELEKARDAAIVERLREAAATGRKGVAGLAATLEALNEHRVERLVVSKGFSKEGWRCPDTGTLHAVGPTHPTTGAPMVRVPDVVEDAVEEALTAKVPVTICVADADLDVLGRIGALLRY